MADRMFLWVAVVAASIAIYGCASEDGELRIDAHDSEVFAQNMLSFLGSQRPAAAQRQLNVTAAPTAPTSPTSPTAQERMLRARVLKEIRQLKTSLQRDTNATLNAAQTRRMRAIQRHVRQLARTSGRTRESRILLEALSMLAGAKIGSMLASDCIGWLTKLSNLAVSVNYGSTTQRPYFQPYYSNALNGYATTQTGSLYYGAPCNDNTYPTCSATSGTLCNNNGLPACYFNWPACNSNVFPVCSTTSGTPCNNNGLPYCVDVGVPCNANSLVYCVNGPTPCNDNNWPYCPGYAPATVG